MLAPLAATLLSAGLMLDGSVRAEARDGANAAGQDPRAAAMELQLNGRTAGPDAEVLFGVLPSVVFAHDSQLYARGYLEVGLHVGHEGWLRARQRVGYGTADLSPVALTTSPGPVSPGTLPPVQSPATERFVRLEESYSLLELDMPVTRRLRLLVSGAWNVSGGADHAAIQTIPLSRGPLARVMLEWAATRIDTLRLEAIGSDSRYSNDNRVTIATLSAGWRTQISRSADLVLAAGAGAGRSFILDTASPTVPPPRNLKTLPHALAAADCRVAPTRDLALALGIAVEPSGDPLTGDLIERGILRGSAVWGREGRISVAARVAGSLAVTSGTFGVNGVQAGDQFFQGELTVSVPVARRAAVDIGGRGAFLTRPLPGQPDNVWIAFVGFNAQLPLLR